MAHRVIRSGTQSRKVVVFEERAEIASFVLEQLERISRRAVERNGRFTIALSGGKTPEDLYAEIGREGQAMPWRAVHIFLVDERFVPPDDDRSNHGMIERTLLRAVPIPAPNVHSIPTVGIEPAMAARAYEEELKRFFGVSEGAVPSFDMILLGMGEDGHTASLFPGSKVLEDDPRLVRAIDAAGERTARISLTLPVINCGSNVFFIVIGPAKAGALRSVVEEEDRMLPATLVRPEGVLLFLCDREAASMLRTGEAARSA